MQSLSALVSGYWGKAKVVASVELTEARPAGQTGSHDAFVGRQPIYDSGRMVHGYELLFRRFSHDRADVVDGNVATAHVLLNSFHVGIENLVGEQLLFLNCTRDCLMMDPILPPDTCVLEVLEDIVMDEVVLARLRDLHERGYKLALDDFVMTEAHIPALRLVDYVKLDVLQLSEEQLRVHVAQLKKYPVKLIAEKIDSEKQLDLCRRLGFQLFQGFYLRKPNVLSAKKIGTSSIAAMRLMLECRNPDKSLHEIASAIKTDLSLTHGLLRLANSILYAGRNPVDSLPQAVARLGMDVVVRWAALLAMAGDSGCPKGYIELALQRAYMCEILGGHAESVDNDKLFLVGMLSVLDAVIGAPMETILGQLPITSELSGAVLYGAGDLGRILSAVVAYQSAEWDAVLDCGLDPQHLRQAYVESLTKASATLSSLTMCR